MVEAPGRVSHLKYAAAVTSHPTLTKHRNRSKACPLPNPDLFSYPVFTDCLEDRSLVSIKPTGNEVYPETHVIDNIL